MEVKIPGIDSLNLLVKYCANRVNADKFFELMDKRYDGDRSYIDNLWPQFRDNPAMFIVSRSEIELLENIQKDIEKIKYTG